MQLREGWRRRADICDMTLRIQNRYISRLQITLKQLTDPPDEEDKAVAVYHEFNGRAWVLFAVILMLIGAALLGVVYLTDVISDSTTFNEVRKPG